MRPQTRYAAGERRDEATTLWRRVRTSACIRSTCSAVATTCSTCAAHRVHRARAGFGLGSIITVTIILSIKRRVNQAQPYRSRCFSMAVDGSQWLCRMAGPVQSAGYSTTCAAVAVEPSKPSIAAQATSAEAHATST